MESAPRVHVPRNILTRVMIMETTAQPKPILCLIILLAISIQSFYVLTNESYSTLFYSNPRFFLTHIFHCQFNDLKFLL
jgi:hypothetical protein